MIRETIRKALAERGITQKKLAEDLGIAPQTICDYLNGRRNLPYDKLEAVIGYLGIWKAR